MPVRIQRRRSKGWRMPEGAVYVGRPSMWGNWAIAPSEYAVDWFRKWLAGGIVTGPYMQRRRARILAELHTLRGRDLACWCPLDRPCHADVLLELANKSEPPHDGTPHQHARRRMDAERPR